MKDIDGYVRKDDLYRLISRIKQDPDIVVDFKTCAIIVEAISNMSNSYCPHCGAKLDGE